MQTLSIAGLIPRSRANGPGLRAVLWMQGCSIGCPGCFNPATHREGGRQASVDALSTELLEVPGLEAITLSGGEPFEQATGLAELLRRLKAARPALSTLAFTGFTLERLRSAGAPAGAEALLAELDLLVDGPYLVKRASQRPWRASANQRLWVLGRLPALDGAGTGAELHVLGDGQVVMSGFPDAELRRAIAHLG